MEVAGVVLGGIPVALYVLDNYKRCLDPAKDYWRYESTITTIRMNVFIQQEQLDAALRSIGLMKPSREELQEHLRELYPQKAAAFLSIINHMEEVIANLTGKLDVDSTGKPKWTDSSPERVNWEWRRIRRSFGRRERQLLIDELQYWNTSLINVFEKSEVISDESDPLVEDIQARFNPKQCDRIRQNAKVVHDALMKTWRCSCEAHCGKLQLHWHNEKFASPTSFEFALPTTSHHCQWCRISVKVKEAGSISNTTPDNQLKPLPEQEAFPSLRKGRPISLKEKWESSNQLMAPESAGNKSISLETTVGSPNLVSCLCSYVENVKTGQRGPVSRLEEKDIYFALDANPLHDKPLQTVTVASILSGKNKASLSRRQRFSIGAATAWGLLCLYGSPWINNEDWNGKDELQLFVEEKGHLELLANECPTISYIFRSTVTGSTGQPGPSSSFPTTAASGDVGYQSSLIRNKLLFGLGIFLIELCLNKTFEQLRQETQSSHPAASSGKQPSVVNDFEIADRQLDKIYLDAGNSYGYAVQRCLRCEFPGRDVTKSFDFEQFRRHFFSGVVAPVQVTFAMQPVSCSVL